MVSYLFQTLRIFITQARGSQMPAANLQFLPKRKTEYCFQEQEETGNERECFEMGTRLPITVVSRGGRGLSYA